jgi:hypothetical protein
LAFGRNADDLKKFVAKSEEVKTRCNLAESCKKGYDPKRAVFPTTMLLLLLLMMMIMMMMRSLPPCSLQHSRV